MHSLNQPSQPTEAHAVRAYLLFHSKDRGHRDALARHLAGLCRRGLVTMWGRSQFPLARTAQCSGVK